MERWFWDHSGAELNRDVQCAKVAKAFAASAASAGDISAAVMSAASVELPEVSYRAETFLFFAELIWGDMKTTVDLWTSPATRDRVAAVWKNGGQL